MHQGIRAITKSIATLNEQYLAQNEVLRKLIIMGNQSAQNRSEKSAPFSNIMKTTQQLNTFVSQRNHENSDSKWSSSTGKRQSYTAKSPLSCIFSVSKQSRHWQKCSSCQILKGSWGKRKPRFQQSLRKLAVTMVQRHCQKMVKNQRLGRNILRKVGKRMSKLK